MLSKRENCCVHAHIEIWEKRHDFCWQVDVLICCLSIKGLKGRD